MNDNSAPGNENQPSEEELQRILRELLSNTGNAATNPETGEPDLPAGLDPNMFASVAGLPTDAASIGALFQTLQQAMNTPNQGIDWNLAATQAQQTVRAENHVVGEAEQQAYAPLLGIAALWLGEATTVSITPAPLRVLSRSEWVSQTMPTWSTLAEPVATSISQALTDALSEQAPEELQQALTGASGLLKSIGGALFATQLGHVVAQLAGDVVSGGDIGIPLTGTESPSLLPQNIAAFSENHDVPLDQLQLYFSVRELAHASLFRHAKWLKLHLISAITEYARGIHVDMTHLEDLAGSFDPANPQSLQNALQSGAFIPEKTEAQRAAHARLESILALIEGWVDVVTIAASFRLPKAEAIAETVRRRRATGGPAESAFATLVGLELRPRRLREAAALWRRVEEVGGPAARDQLWEHPDLLPSSAELDDPEELLRRLGYAQREPTGEADFDEALTQLLEQAERERAEREHPQPGEGDTPDETPGR